MLLKSTIVFIILKIVCEVNCAYSYTTLELCNARRANALYALWPVQEMERLWKFMPL